MNKITQRSLRDLHATLPEGTECYLCAAVRKALAKYRRNREPAVFMEKEQALSALARKLGRGLKRFFPTDIRTELDTQAERGPPKSSGDSGDVSSSPLGGKVL
jgi:hypothetical protein